MTSEHRNQHAGQGPVVLDIGDDIGALVIMAPADLVGREIEARPVGATRPAQHATVLPRRIGRATVYGVVISELMTGEYELTLLPDGPPGGRVAVTGGEVTQTQWPAVG